MVGLLQLKPLSYIGSTSEEDLTKMFGWLYQGLHVKCVMVPQVNDLQELQKRRDDLLFEVLPPLNSRTLFTFPLL
jgi:hypothetical protein